MKESKLNTFLLRSTIYLKTLDTSRFSLFSVDMLSLLMCKQSDSVIILSFILFCAFSRRVSHIMCHPKPVTPGWNWLIKPSLSKFAPMLTYWPRATLCCVHHSTFYIKVPCNYTYKHLLIKYCHTDVNNFQVTLCLKSNVHFFSLENGRCVYLNVKGCIFRVTVAKTK